MTLISMFLNLKERNTYKIMESMFTKKGGYFTGLGFHDGIFYFG